MEYNLITNIESCYTDVPSLLYYSHIPAAIIALFLGTFILIKSKGNRLAAKIFFLISVVFSSWVLIEGAIWLQYSSVTMMFLWSLLGLLYSLLHVLSIYFVYAFFDRQDVTRRIKFIFVLLLLPIILLTATKYNITGFDIENCQALEGNYFIMYRYFVGIVSILWIVGLIYSRYRKAEKISKKQILLVGSGVLVYLFLFSWSEIVGSLTENFDITQYGLFGMPVLLALLSYTMVKFKTFSIKLIGAQALILSLVAVIGSEFFFIQTDINRILTAITLIITGVIGINLIRSVKKEVAQREQIEKQEKELEITNEKLTDLTKRLKSVNSIMSHDVKNVLGKNKDLLWEMMEGTFGEISSELRMMSKQIFVDTVELISSVMNILKSGQEMKPDYKEFDLKAAVLEVVDSVKDKANEKGLKIETHIDENQNYTIIADHALIVTHVLQNLVENAVNFTLRGSITVGLSKKDPMTLLFSVKDTGVGISEEDKKKLFTEGGHGADSIKINVHSTGYGLFIAKKTVDVHKGRIWQESEVGKGTTFFVELPAKQ